MISSPHGKVSHTLNSGNDMIEIEQRHIDYYCGQHDMALDAKLDGEPAGTLLYAVYEGDPSVTTIDVPKGLRRRGIATALVIALQDEYPDTPIEFGGLTDLGAALLNSIEWDVRENETHNDAVRNLAPIDAKLADYSARADKLGGATQAERDAFSAETSDWNDLHNEADRLRDIVENTASTFRFAVGPRAAPSERPRSPSP
ncbi:GNAT family N-acetyltransferase [Pararhizobium sp. BT-229]|uniref:GNAT family N-acetyltransferase n=1 Tax=Pararhizobium sp. BT-229 TaxID=2986923 RepID=UPI0021F6FB7D|nr:GNAT family N-acetyltransferase [Pararhizobium sp. BT-229]MCV9964365.1 GNAT family N-acetyltransferase [Pararhizobium sp. BT-229]